MGYRIAIRRQTRPALSADSWLVTLEVALTRAESNTLFLAGDSILAWPTGGLQGDPDQHHARGLERTSMFVSEVAARDSGLRIHYSKQAEAEQAVVLLRKQLAMAGIEEE